MTRKMKCQLTVFLILLVSSVLSRAEDEATEGNKTTEELVEIADGILEGAKEDNIAAVREVHQVFDAAERLREEKSLENARFYFENGLQISPWNMDAQLSYAKVLLNLSEVEGARRTALIVLKTSERQSLLEDASKISGVALPGPLSILPNQEFEEKVFCLVPIGPVQNWILTKAGERLSKTLGVKVYQYQDILARPAPHRSFFERWTDNLKKNIVWEHPWIVEQMKDIGILSAETADANQVLELLARIDVEQGKEDPRSKFAEFIRKAKERDQQWDAAILLDMLISEIRNKHNVTYIGITEADMFNNDNNFLFGLARTGSNFALLSYCRYRAWFHQERESQTRLLDRIHKQLLSSSGFALGISRPTDPRSARSYPNGLNDHDLKGTWLSPECILGFEEALGQPLPQRTKEESKAGSLGQY